MNRVRVQRLVVALVALLLAPFGAAGAPVAAVRAQEGPETVRLDYAYYNPSSLVLRRFGWLEEELKADGIGVEWTLSAGSNKANEFLRAEAVDFGSTAGAAALLAAAVDFGSTAGAAALLAAANGSPIRTVYIYSKPEWAALVVAEGSEITEVAQLEGKKVAATKGTDPYFFLLRSLAEVGLSGSDVEVVNLQHADGRTALERGQVDAWAGLDPHMAASELDAVSRLLYRNIDFNTYGFLNARTEFVEDYPELTTRVLAAYERARRWILDNPDEAAQILADEAKISLAVARRELEHAAVLRAVIPIFAAENQVRPGTDVEAVLGELLAPSFAEQAVAAAGGTPAATPAP